MEAIMKKKQNGVQIKYIPLESPLKEKAEKEIGETQEKAVKCIEELRKKILCDGDFQCPLKEDFLMKFLRANKFNMNETYENIRSFSKNHTRWPEVYKVDPKEILEKMIKTRVFVVSPEKDNEGGVVVTLILGNFCPPEHSYDDIWACYVLFSDILMREPENQIGGFSLVIDCTGYGLPQAKYCTPAALQKIASLYENGLGFNLKGMHLHCENQYFMNLFSIFVKLLPEKLQQKMHYYGHDLDKLHKIIPKSVLPTELGGTCDSSNTAFIAKVQAEDISIKDAAHACHAV